MSWRTGVRVTRHTFALLLVVVASVLAPVALLAYWTREEIVDTDEFVASVAPLVEDRQIQDAVIDRWAPRVVKLADDFAPGLITQDEVVSALQAVVRSDTFAESWRVGARAAHPQLQRVLTGRDTDLLRTSNGTIVIDLDGLGGRARDALVANGFPQFAQLDLESVDLDLPVYHSRQLVRFQHLSGFAVRYGIWLVGAWLALVVLALVVAPNRRRALVWLATGSLVGASAAGAGLAFARLRYHARLESLVPRSVSGRAFDILAAPLELRVRIWFLVAVVLVIVGLLLSPTRRSLRQIVRPDISAGRRWIAGHVADLCISLVAAGAAVLAWWQAPTMRVVIVVGAAVALAVVAVIVTGRWHTRRQPAADAA